MSLGREKKPLNPVQLRKPPQWPPKNARQMEVMDADTWWTVAARLGMDPWALIMFNFDTHVPEEVNWYLRELVGCRHITENLNYTFQGSNRTIYRPPTPVPPKPAPITWQDQLKKLQYEIEHTMTPSDPLKSRFLCMCEKMQIKDAAIFWNDIAPGYETPVPLGGAVVAINPYRSLADAQWQFDNIKTWEDVQALPHGDGTDPRRFVVSLRKVLFVVGHGSLSELRSANQKMSDTHVMLERWANFALGGSSSLPRDYRAIREWVRLAEGSDTPMSCIATTGF